MQQEPKTVGYIQVNQLISIYEEKFYACLSLLRGITMMCYTVCLLPNYIILWKQHIGLDCFKIYLYTVYVALSTMCGLTGDS